MTQYLLAKAVRSLLTIWLVITLTFVALHLSGDPIEAMVGDQASPEVVARYTEKFGFDRPLPEQYFSYIVSIAQGDFGVSLSDRKPALELLAQAVPQTLVLGLTAFSGGLLVGLILGIVAALNRNKPIDRFVMSFAVFGFSIPNFFLGILLILLFVLQWRLLPSSGSGTARHLVLPAITLGLHFAGTFARFTRSAMLEVINKQYLVAARARGVPRMRRVLCHALPNALIPIITIVGIKFGDLIAGSIVVETVFAWPGVGRLLVNAVTATDFAVVQAVVIVVAISMIAANLVVDLIYILVDPRMRASKSGG